MINILALPAPGLQQTLPPLAYRSLLRYRLGLPLSVEPGPCSRCGQPQDEFGDHAVLCRAHAALGGYQSRHRVVQAVLCDVLREAGVAHMREPPAFTLHAFDTDSEGVADPSVALGAVPARRPADVLLYHWDGDTHYCLDLVGTSPACARWSLALERVEQVETAKVRRHSALCAEHGYGFVPFAFSAVGSFGPAAQRFLRVVSARYAAARGVSHSMAAHIVYSRLSFAVQRGVAAQLLARHTGTLSF